MQKKFVLMVFSIPSRFQIISKTAGSCVLPLSRNRFFENAPREEPELLGACTWTSLCFSRDFFARRSPSTTRNSPSTHRNWASDIPVESCCKHITFPCWSFFILAMVLKFFIWNSFSVVVELHAVFTLNFCDVFLFVRAPELLLVRTRPSGYLRNRAFYREFFLVSHVPCDVSVIFKRFLTTKYSL